MKLLRVTFITAKGKVVEVNAWVQTVLRDGHPMFVAGNLHIMIGMLDAYVAQRLAERCKEEEEYSLQKHITELREELRELHLREEELLEELERLTGDHF